MNGRIKMVIFVFILASLVHMAASTTTVTNGPKIHEKGYCAFYDYCGENNKGSLPCPDNRKAVTVDDDLAIAIAQYCPSLWKEISMEQLSCCTVDTVTNTYKRMSQAFQIIQGCPACLNNFAYLWCTLSCSPNQSLFADVLKTAIDPVTNLTVVNEVDIYFSEEFKNLLFHSCKEVKYSLANIPFMSLLGSPETPKEFLELLGTPEEGGGEAPYRLNFRHEDETPKDMEAFTKQIPTCGSPGFECSCADCSSAAYCQMITVDDEEEDSKCKGVLRCYEYGIVVIGIIALIMVVWLIWFSTFELSMQDIGLPDDQSEHSYDALDDDEEYHAVLLEGEHLQYPRVEKWLRRMFHAIGMMTAKYPFRVIVISLVVVAMVSLGNINYSLETSPQGLWTPKDSRSEKEQEKYRNAFGPYYRVENLIFRTTPDSPSTGLSITNLPRIVSKRNIDLMFEIQDIVNSLEAHVKDVDTLYSVTLQDVCYKPLGTCVTESVLQYWQMDRDNWNALFDPDDPDPEFWATVLADDCFQHWTTKCRSNFKSPIDPKVVLGGFPLDETFQSYVNDTTAFVITYLLSSDDRNEQAALAWEDVFIEAAKSNITDIAEAAGLRVSFRAEKSIEDEIHRETYMDAVTIIVSYIVMFVYISISLTFLTRKHQSLSANLLVQSHVSLAFQGICIVVLSVISALGLVSLFGMKVSLIVLEVIPFLILAVGVDNMFILANEYRSLSPGLSVSQRLGTALAEVGPSITCAAVAEGVAFGLAAIAPIPAVRTFALCACFAVFCNFFLQATLFSALLVLDTIRRESGRVDCVPCLQAKQEHNLEEPLYVVTETGTPSQHSDAEYPENILQQAINKYFVPFIFSSHHKVVRWTILSLTVIGFIISLILLGRMERGMEEQVAFPSDSYLQDYFTNGLPLMRVGAPVLFVVNALNVSSSAGEDKTICGIAGCTSDSLVSQIDLAAKSHAYHLASPVSSWVDDFLMWLNTPSCCRTHGNSTEFCSSDDADTKCIPCSISKLDVLNKYQRFLPEFMKSIPNEICPRGGKGVYEDYIQHEIGNSSAVVGLSNEIIQASSFRTYYTPLITQTDYIEALTDTNNFADDLGKSLGLDIYGYSVFHVFFQQYLHIEEVAVIMITVAVLAIFIVCWFLLSNFKTALLLLICVLMIMIDLIGVSYLLDVKLNGVSIVNITMALGIAVEFCVHLAHGFLMLPGSRIGRISSAFRGIGLSIISGITITKFVGVIVLAFATTKLFKIYYFRMYMSLVLLGAWHGLIVLPILLVLFGPGPPVIKAKEPSHNNNNNNEELEKEG